MTDRAVANLLPLLRTRREYFDYFDNWTVDTVDELRAHRTSRALVKAYLLETSSSDSGRDVKAALTSARQGVSDLDDSTLRLRWYGEESDWAIVEADDQRYPILYTAVEAETANWRVDNLIRESPRLDRAWFASPIFNALWEMVINAYPDHRLSQIVFEYDSVYESLPDESIAAPLRDSEQDTDVGDVDEDWVESSPPWIERRRARIQISERIGKLKEAIPSMRPAYDPLWSIVRLRVPAPKRGGHDVYFDGRFTNRSDSVTSLRQTIKFVTDLYRRSTELAEKAAWPELGQPGDRDHGISLGLPLLIRFNKELAASVFDGWVASLRRRNNRFRIWGNPIELGSGKVHIYAVDNHLWQPLDLELTRDHIYALLPHNTCGNTIHRLIANVQRFLDPKPEAYIGQEKYEMFIDRAKGNQLIRLSEC